MNDKTKLIFEEWRRFLNESTIDRIRKSIQNLYFHSKSKNDKGYIVIDDYGNSVDFLYEGLGVSGLIVCDNISVEAGYDIPSKANGRNVWQISQSNVDKSWGSLLYEVCLEYISCYKKGTLMSDRNSVSSDAESVWEKYLKRSNTEENLNYIQMDFGELGSNQTPDSEFRLNNDLENNIGLIHDDSENYIIYNKVNDKVYQSKIEKYSPDNLEDDINQYSTFKNLINKGIDLDQISKEWIKSPLSKAFYKDNLDIINQLEDLNLIIIEKTQEK